MKSDALDTDGAKRVSGIWFCKYFWHNQLQCKLYQRHASGAAESWGDAEARLLGVACTRLLGLPLGQTPPGLLASL
jgi:hypothetical protein